MPLVTMPRVIQKFALPANRIESIELSEGFVPYLLCSRPKELFPATIDSALGDDFRNMNPEAGWARFHSMGWKSKLELWPYVLLAISVLGFAYLILRSHR